VGGDYTLLVTDANLTVVGDPITNWTSLDVTLRFNEPDSGLFAAPGYPWVREQLNAGARIVVIRNPDPAAGMASSVLTAGPIEKWLYERSDDGENAGDGKVTVNFADDMAWVAARLTYPDPALTPEAQVIDAWTYSGNAETALRTAVNLNAGPGALTPRVVPRLALGAVAGVGLPVDVTAERMEPLGDVLRRIADLGGGLGFQTRQQGTQILFEVYQPADKTASVRFSFSLGNMKYLAYEVTSPTATAAIVGGQGEGSDRYMLERVNAASQAAWGRSEILVSRAGSADVADLQADGDKALVDGDQTVRLPSNVADTPTQRYGIHYNLGDKVAIESFPGEQVADIVRTVHLQAWPTAGEVVSATVGSQAASSDPAWIQRLRAIDARVGRLERNVLPA
jgi:hypothetical protein